MPVSANFEKAEKLRINCLGEWSANPWPTEDMVNHKNKIMYFCLSNCIILIIISHYAILWLILGRNYLIEAYQNRFFC